MDRDRVPRDRGDLRVRARPRVVERRRAHLRSAADAAQPAAVAGRRRRRHRQPERVRARPLAVVAQRARAAARYARARAAGGRGLRRAVYRAVSRRSRVRRRDGARADLPAGAAESRAGRQARARSAGRGARRARDGARAYQSRSRSGRHRAQRRAVRGRRPHALAAADGARLSRDHGRQAASGRRRAGPARARPVARRDRRRPLSDSVQPQYARVSDAVVRRRARRAREARCAARQDRRRWRDRVGALRPLRDARVRRFRPARRRLHPRERARHADDRLRDFAGLAPGAVRRVALAARGAARRFPDAVAVARAAADAEPRGARGDREHRAAVRGARLAVAGAGRVRADRRVSDLELAAPRDDDVVPAPRAAAARRRTASAAGGAARAASAATCSSARWR